MTYRDLPRRNATNRDLPRFIVTSPLLCWLQAWMQGLVARQQDDLYRLKGLLAIAGEARRFVLHGVHAQVTTYRYVPLRTVTLHGVHAQVPREAGVKRSWMGL